jgi:hypothetical protein
MRVRWLFAAGAFVCIGCDAIYGIQQLAGSAGGDGGAPRDAAVNDTATSEDSASDEDSAAGGGFVDVQLTCPFDGAVSQPGAALEWAEWPMPNDPTDVSSGAPNPESYTNNGDGTVTDDVTKLMWMESPSTVTNGDVFGNVDNDCAELSLAGYCDWRLPTYVELMSIVDLSRQSPAIDPAFKNTTPVAFWSSTPVAGATQYWIVYFSDGHSVPGNVSGVHHGRCVRGGSATDGGPPPGRYVIGNGTVQDTATGLVWEQASASTSSSWSSAAGICTGLGLDTSNWRLPTLRELITIVDVAQSSPTVDSVFTAESKLYWSSSSEVGSTTSAWAANFATGTASTNDTSNSYAVRCVH